MPFLLSTPGWSVPSCSAESAAVITSRPLLQSLARGAAFALKTRRSCCAGPRIGSKSNLAEADRPSFSLGGVLASDSVRVVNLQRKGQDKDLRCPDALNCLNNALLCFLADWKLEFGLASCRRAQPQRGMAFDPRPLERHEYFSEASVWGVCVTLPCLGVARGWIGLRE